MEIFIGVAVIAGFIYFLFSFEHPNTNGDPSETTLRDQSSPKRNLSGQTGIASHPAFDEGSSKHLPERRILTGAAYVVDGDTVKISNTQVRLFGIDAPELNHPYGKKAKWALHAFCKGQVVRAEMTDEDAYGRTVAQCFLADGRDLSAEMVTCSPEMSSL